MLKGIVGQLAMLVVAMVLYPDLADSQCTTKDCKDHDKVDVLSVCLRNQQVVKELQEELRTLSLNEKRNHDVVEQLQQELDSNQKVVEQLRQELRALNSKEERLQQEVNSTEERNQELLGWLQQQVNELKQKFITLETKFFLGTSRHNAARSCKQILDSASYAANGVYWICISPNCVDVHEVFCDMRSGGWTLIGQIGGVAGNIHEKWLRTDENTEVLLSPWIEQGTFGCIDAVDMAVNRAHEIRISSGEINTGMGEFWVEWDLPSNRSVDTFWRHAQWPYFYRSTLHKVEVRSSFAPSHNCYQNVYGIMKTYGSGYPATSPFPNGGMSSRDVCMSVAVIDTDWLEESVNMGVLYDAPRNNSDWPNAEYQVNGGPPFVSVWLR